MSCTADDKETPADIALQVFSMQDHYKLANVLAAGYVLWQLFSCVEMFMLSLAL